MPVKTKSKKKRDVRGSKRIVIVDEFPQHAIDKWSSLDITLVYPFSVAEWLKIMKKDGYEIVSYVRNKKIRGLLKKSNAPIDRYYKGQYTARRPGDEFLVVEEDDGDLKGWYVTAELPK
jgi:hypothetical protein